MKRAAVVGGGHNGLVAACYLARAGFHVTLHERRKLVGGLSSSEELFPGCSVSSVATRSGMLRKHIIHDLNLRSHGLELFVAKYASHIIYSGDAFTSREGTQGETYSFKFRELQPVQVEEWGTFWREISAAGAILGRGISQLGYSTKQFLLDLDENDLGHLAEALFHQNLLEYARPRVSHPAFLSALLTMSGCTPLDPAALFDIIYYSTAESHESLGQWGYARGGMGAITQALQREAVRLGVAIKLESPIDRVFNDGAGPAVFDALGGSTRYDAVVLATDPITSYRHLLREHSSEFPQALRRALQSPLSESTYAILHLRLSDLPNCPILSQIGREGADAYWGAFDFSVEAEELEATSKLPSRDASLDVPNLSCNVMSAFDSTVTSGKGHVMSVLYQACSAGAEWNEQMRSAMILNVIERLSPFIPNLKNIVTATHLITPADFRDVYGVNSNYCLHLRLAKEHVLENRPFEGSNGVRTPISGVYLSGAGAYPGGCVSGQPGYLCAQQVIADLKALYEI
jgi:phytoene dehydrogenase-like protein